MYFSSLTKVINAEGNETYSCIKVWTAHTLEDCSFFSTFLAEDSNATKLHLESQCKEYSPDIESRSLSKCLLPTSVGETTHYIARFIFGFCLPAALTVFFYCKIGQKIRQSETMLSSIGNQSRSNSKTVSRNIAIFLLATLLGSAPCLLFYFIRLTKIDFGVDFCHKLIYVKDWFLISCPMINAIIYSFLGRKFRRDLVRVFCKKYVPAGDASSSKKSARTKNTNLDSCRISDAEISLIATSLKR
ncbi:Oidioi.mRNA.OKI2018_I69.XSR.g13590.t1.cds [Oikopleura dioica]|uniref:Oidioi.mRNA.OKI2018_I69.XSR.g13590.t1.cds n=1 Tax=Oikopleura dioica TaxID=34765 RepID=A0ABN7SB20_OIKDI|nr:Oidioi.mRNA.OKI2018_I69.XSR.g13590.t1.cds [Oikopleura dioica]